MAFGTRVLKHWVLGPSGYYVIYTIPYYIISYYIIYHTILLGPLLGTWQQVRSPSVWLSSTVLGLGAAGAWHGLLLQLARKLLGNPRFPLKGSCKKGYKAYAYIDIHLYSAGYGCCGK